MKIFYFVNVFSYHGERFLQIFWCQQGKIRACRPKIDPQIDTFVQVDIRFLAILGVEKVVFWTFSRLLWTYLESVFGLKRPTFACILAPKVDKRPNKSKFSVKNLLILAVLRGHFWNFRGRKSHFLDLFKVVLELFRKC